MNKCDSSHINQESLEYTVECFVRNILLDKTKKNNDLYDLILSIVEPVIFKTVMDRSRQNQLQAAKKLGLSRGTMRSRLFKYFGNKYFRLCEE